MDSTIDLFPRFLSLPPHDSNAVSGLEPPWSPPPVAQTQLGDVAVATDLHLALP